MMNRTVSIAPMMRYTDRHYRYLMRLMTKHTLLYTVMLTTSALIQGDYKKLLAYNLEEHPLALQLGGSHPQELATCAKMAEEFGYDEVNLNAGCPSDRVQSGQFGACLMKTPERVADCIFAMQSAVKIPVTIKTRIGVDEMDDYAHLHRLVELVAHAGCKVFIIHARKAWLHGLSPAENRHIPPLRYEVVHQLKRDFPHLTIVINGGINALEEIEAQLPYVDGVMLGRAAYHHPYLFSEVDTRFFGDTQSPLPQPAVIREFFPYIQAQLKKDIALHTLTQHLTGFFQGQNGARRWRQTLSLGRSLNFPLLEAVLTSIGS
ncbi:MAG TPA: tRNA dihydrouridine(20/20a) synthase DusA [Coxiellaceae bacterium]|nr:tRNA dihydrouridine(20/20a) synthase DusA [Coxiellaceae bacterium]